MALGEDFLSLPINLFLYTCRGLLGHSWPGHSGTCQLAFDQYVSFVLHSGCSSGSSGHRPTVLEIIAVSKIMVSLSKPVKMGEESLITCNV